MKYMLLLYDDESNGAEPGTPEFDEMMAGYEAFSAEVRDKGAYVHGEPLHGSDSARSIRRVGESVMVTDGPFLETREQLGGFYILECQSLAEAEDFATRIPAATSGRVEVRQMAGHEQRLLEPERPNRYVAFIYGDESRFVPMGSKEHGTIIGGHQRFTSALIESDEFITGDGLHLSKDAKTVSVRDGATIVTDGPYAETREVLGGFYEFVCEGPERAVELGGMLLFNDNGGIEIRPVMDLGEM
jgi:hypothetical protein